MGKRAGWNNDDTILFLPSVPEQSSVTINEAFLSLSLCLTYYSSLEEIFIVTT